MLVFMVPCNVLSSIQSVFPLNYILFETLWLWTRKAVTDDEWMNETKYKIIFQILLIYVWLSLVIPDVDLQRCWVCTQVSREEVTMDWFAGTQAGICIPSVNVCTCFHLDKVCASCKNSHSCFQILLLRKCFIWCFLQPYNLCLLHVQTKGSLSELALNSTKWQYVYLKEYL